MSTPIRQRDGHRPVSGSEPVERVANEVIRHRSPTRSIAAEQLFEGGLVCGRQWRGEDVQRQVQGARSVDAACGSSADGVSWLPVTSARRGPVTWISLQERLQVGAQSGGGHGDRSSAPDRLAGVAVRPGVGGGPRNRVSVPVGVRSATGVAVPTTTLVSTTEVAVACAESWRVNSGSPPSEGSSASAAARPARSAATSSFCFLELAVLGLQHDVLRSGPSRPDPGWTTRPTVRGSITTNQPISTISTASTAPPAEPQPLVLGAGTHLRHPPTSNRWLSSAFVSPMVMLNWVPDAPAQACSRSGSTSTRPVTVFRRST